MCYKSVIGRRPRGLSATTLSWISWILVYVSWTGQLPPSLRSVPPLATCGLTSWHTEGSSVIIHHRCYCGVSWVRFERGASRKSEEILSLR